MRVPVTFGCNDWLMDSIQANVSIGVLYTILILWGIPVSGGRPYFLSANKVCQS